MGPRTIDCQGVSKAYRQHGRELFRERVARVLRRQPPPLFYALRDVSFGLSAGRSLAVIGANGAGKSTLLGIIAGLSRPDEGRIAVAGRICPLLQLGAGFHPDLTGSENVTLNAALLGLGRARLAELRPRIVEFSGIADFIDEPLRTYSSGMVLRLAFSVAIHVDPDVLVIDELLAVGDPSFQENCLRKIRELRDAGKTLVCASHDLHTLRALCDEAVWLERGKLVSSGPIDEVLASYQGVPAAVG